MAKRDNRAATLVCGADACYEVPAFGSDYCMRHSLESHAPVKRRGGVWLWLLVALVPALWLLVNARSLAGK